MSECIIGERLQSIPEFISLEPKSKPVFFCACPCLPVDIMSSLREIELRCGDPEIFYARPGDCTACFYVPRRDFTLTQGIVYKILFFFARDGSEAQVFEWDWMEDRFFARRRSHFENAKRIVR